MANSNPKSRSEIGEAEQAVTVLENAVNQGPESIMTSELSVPDLSEETGHIYPWDRQPEETDFGWALFCHHRDSGITRSLDKTVEAMLEKYPPGYTTQGGINLNVASLKQRSYLFGWSERTEAFDKEQERLYQIARGLAIREMADRHEETIVEAIGSLMVPIKALQLAMEEDEGFIKSLSKTDAKKLISMSNIAARTIPSLLQAERLARGMPTEIVSGVIEHQVTHTIERDQIGEVLEVLERAGALDDRSGSVDAGEIVDAEVVEVHSVPAESDD